MVLAEPKAHKVEGEPESAGVHVQGFMRGIVGSGNDPGGQDQGQSWGLGKYGRELWAGVSQVPWGAESPHGRAGSFWGRGG